MTIQITRQLTHEQYMKLFSNPISGIACEVGAYDRDHIVKYACRNVRYSKSMLIRAIGFWSDQIFNMYLRITRITNPLEPMTDIGIGIMDSVDYLENTKRFIQNLPDSFLFSHRYINELSDFKLNDALKIQKKMILEKYPKVSNDLWFQHITLQPFFKTNGDLPYGLSFTVFPNEHPYVKREKILEVGQTSKGNTFVIKG